MLFIEQMKCILLKNAHSLFCLNNLFLLNFTHTFSYFSQFRTLNKIPQEGYFWFLCQQQVIMNKKNWHHWTVAAVHYKRGRWKEPQSTSCQTSKDWPQKNVNSKSQLEHNPPMMSLQQVLSWPSRIFWIDLHPWNNISLFPLSTAVSAVFFLPPKF